MERCDIRSETKTTIDNVSALRTKIETTSVRENDLISDTNSEHDCELNIDNDTELTTSDPAKLNTLAPINRLPVELFTHIMFLMHLPLGAPSRWEKQLYLPYTWVCHHWRSILVQIPKLWTSVELESGEHDNPTHPFVHELLQRSKSSELDAVIWVHCDSFPSNLNDLIAEESGRIGRLWLVVEDEHLVQLLSGKRFPKLRGLSYMCGKHGLNGLLPILLSSDYLETLQCTVLGSTPDDAIDRLIPVFSHIQNLHLDIQTFHGGELAPLLDLLYDNDILHMLILDVQHGWQLNFTDRINLPELRYLSADNPFIAENILAPKISNLNLFYNRIPATIPQAFDFSSIQYLYVGGEDCITGLKERTTPTESLISKETKSFIECSEDIVSGAHINSVQEAISVRDMLYDICPCNCFKFEFSVHETMTQALGTTLHSLLSRMTNLRELYLLSRSLVEYTGTLDEIISKAPVVEKLVLYYGYKLTEFIRALNDPSLCPRLTHLSYITDYIKFDSREEIDNCAEAVGRTLTECVQSRYEVNGDRLEYIALHHCPPLPDTWLRELQRLGVTVVTAKDAESLLGCPCWRNASRE